MKEIDKIKSALKTKWIKVDLPWEVESLAWMLDKKKSIAILWESDGGKELQKALLDDSARCLSAITHFESLTFDEVKSHLAKYRANMTLLKTMSEINSIDSIQKDLDDIIRQSIW